MAGSRELLTSIITKAITTGSKTEDERRSPRDQAFFAGRVSGYVNSAAMLAEHLYGADYEASRKIIGDAVKLVRRDMPVELRRTGAPAIRESAARITIGVLYEGS